jgi:Tfp pilus assembly protein PilF
LTCFDEVLKDSPENAVAWANRGVILAEFGELDSALQCLDVALQHEPNAAIVLANRGLTLVELGRDVEALACFEKAIQLERYSRWPGGTRAKCSTVWAVTSRPTIRL